MRVLLVDDEIELVSTLAERLSFRGIDADWATCEEEVFDKLKADTYDIIILDMKMPKISGLKLKKKIDLTYPNMKYIIMTGHGSEEDFKAASMEKDITCYLVKPIQIDKLINTIFQCVNK